MSRSLIQTAYAAITIFACVGLAWAQSATVIRSSGRQARGDVGQVDRNGVTIDGERIPVSDIRMVLFGGEPSAMRQVRDAVARGSYTAAERYLERLDDTADLSDEIQADLAFYRAYTKARLSLQTGQGLGPAARELLSFVRDHVNSIHFYDAAETLGELATALNSPGEAAKYFGALEKSPDPAIRVRGNLRMAESFLQAGDYQTAATRFAAVAAEAGSDPADRDAAVIGEALCQAKLGQPADGIEKIEKIVSAADPTSNGSGPDGARLAKAYNALGACHQAAGDKKAALEAYLHVELLYPQQTKDLAVALRELIPLWSQLGHPDRSREVQQRLEQLQRAE